MNYSHPRNFSNSPRISRNANITCNRRKHHRVPRPVIWSRVDSYRSWRLRNPYRYYMGDCNLRSDGNLQRKAV